MMKRELKGQGYIDPCMEPLQWSPSQTQKVLILFLTSSEHKAKIYSSSERTFKVYTHPVLTDVSIMSPWSLDPIESWMFPHHRYNWESATTLWLQREVKNKAVPSWVPWFHPLKAASQEDSGDLGSIAVLVQVDCPCWACWCTVQGGGGTKILQWRVDLKQNKRNSLWSGFGFFSSAPTTAHALTRH